MDLDGVADELYGLDAADFVPTRNARAKEARAAGDRDLAAAITALAKPTRVAWLANQLVRRRRGDIEPLLELGAALREATATLSGDDLRRLAGQQHRLVHALVQQAKSLAGGPVSDDVADALDRTLRAALADDALAEQLLQGRLTEGLEFTGFGGEAPAGPARPRLAAVPTRTDGEAKRRQAEADRERAETAVAEAGAANASAEAERQRTQGISAQAEDESRQLGEEADRLQAELEEKRAQHILAEREARTARAAYEHSEQAARVAARRLAKAEEALRDLP